MTHPVTGAVLAVDRYRPTKDLERALRVRDEHCRFPGCRQPFWRCDVDHSHDAARGGETSERNLAHLCRRHHTLKHATSGRCGSSAAALSNGPAPPALPTSTSRRRRCDSSPTETRRPSDG